MTIDSIYASIFTELKELIANEYESYVDPYHPNVANNYKEALHQVVQGSIKKGDTHGLQELIGNHRISKYLEIGSYVGLSFRVINELFNIGESYSIDPNIPHRVFRYPRNIFVKLNQKFDYKTTLLNAFWFSGGQPTINANYFNNFGIKFDLIFIDAFHEYERVKSDFTEALKILSVGGIILLHDIYSWRGVNKFVKELEKNNNYVVKKIPKTNQIIDGFATIGLA